MNLLNKDYLVKYDDNQYVWYACYGSNINYDRFMYYINGDINGKFSEFNGCKDKSLPLEVKQYIFKHPVYFAGISKRWVEEWHFQIMNMMVNVMEKFIK